MDTPKPPDPLPKSGQSAETKAPSEVSAVTDTIAAGKDEAAGKIGNLLGIDAVEDPVDKEVLRAAWMFLQDDGEKNVGDIVRHVTDVGNVSMGYEMAGVSAPDVVNEIHVQLQILFRRRHIFDAWRELRQPAPDLLTLLEHVRMASDNAASVPADVQKDIERLKAAIKAREIRSETYDRMCALAGVVETAIPYLAERKNSRTPTIVVAALLSGDLTYINVAMKLASDLRLDVGRHGIRSQEKLRAIADRIVELAGQLLSAGN